MYQFGYHVCFKLLLLKNMKELEIVLHALTTKEEGFEHYPMAHQMCRSKSIPIEP
jgi:hypothetical protein